MFEDDPSPFRRRAEIERAQQAEAPRAGGQHCAMPQAYLGKAASAELSGAGAS